MHYFSFSIREYIMCQMFGAKKGKKKEEKYTFLILLFQLMNKVKDNVANYATYILKEIYYFS